MKICYLIQGARHRLEGLSLPAGACVYALCYDDPAPTLPEARAIIFDPVCSWAEGRNRLLELALDQEGDAEYLVFCDDDVEFISGSFEQFEARLRETRPLAAVPLMPKARVTGYVLPDVDHQAAIAVDEQMVALHRTAVGDMGIAPLETMYDNISWYIPCLIFEYRSLKAFGSRFHQYNDVEIVNNSHTWLTEGVAYRQGDPNEFLPVVKSALLASSSQDAPYEDDILGIMFPALASLGFDLETARERRRTAQHDTAPRP